MSRAVNAGLLLLLLAGCRSPIRTESTVHMHGKMDGRVRTEMEPLVDVGPLQEVVVAKCGGDASGKVAVLDVDGVLTNVNHTGPYSLGENPVSVFKEKLDACAADPSVKAVVLRINTPGGGVAATDLMWHELVRFRQATHKPVVACLLDLGAGGGYFLATACDTILAIPSSIVGGIGVLLNVYDAEKGVNMINVFPDFIRSGNKIDMGTSIRKMDKDERDLLEAMARGYHERFKRVVLQARPKVAPTSDVFDGRVMTGPQGVEAGLVDAVGYLDDAVALAGKLGHAEHAEAVMFRRCGDAARTLYASTPNRPIHSNIMPLSIPGPDRSKLPLFLYMWQPDPTLLKLSGV